MNTDFRFGQWTAQVRTRSLIGPGQSVRLERKAMDVLVEMARAAPGPVSSEELMERVWAGVVVGDGALYRVIALLRKVLGDDSRAPTYIESIPRLGYRLLVPVHFVAGTAPRVDPADAQPDLAVRRFTALALARSGAEPDVAQELAAQVSRHVGWSSGAFQVFRQTGELPDAVDYLLRIAVARVEGGVRVGWEMLYGPSRKLLWASDHVEPAADFCSRQERIAELIAEGVAKNDRRSRLEEWDRDPQSPRLGYWDLVLLSDHYRSMASEQIETRRAMLQRALRDQPGMAAAHAAYADFLSWEVANGISCDARAALDTAAQEASTALDLGGGDPYVLSRCGEAYSRTGDHVAGVELCRRAFALAPSTLSRELLTRALCYSGQPEEAIAHSLWMIETMPAGHVYQYGRIVVPLVQADRLDEALTYSQLAVIHFPKDYFCWSLRANLLAHFGEMEQAAEAFARAQALMPALTLASLIDGTNRTYGRTSEQQDLLTGGLIRLMSYLDG